MEVSNGAKIRNRYNQVPWCVHEQESDLLEPLAMLLISTMAMNC